MAIQGFTTGRQSVLMMAPVKITGTGASKTIELATPVPISTINSVNDFYEKYDASTFLELALFSSTSDQTGIISTSLSLDAEPKTIAFTIDRYDIWTLRFLQRYCKSLRSGLERPSTTPTTAKQYEDGLEVRGEAAAEEVILPTDTIFFVSIGPNFRDIQSAGMTEVIYGFAGISSSSANYSSSYDTDNQFTFTLIAAPQEVDATINLEDFVFNSVVGAKFGKEGGKHGLNHWADAIEDGKIGNIFQNYDFEIIKNTGIITDSIKLLTN